MIICQNGEIRRRGEQMHGVVDAAERSPEKAKNVRPLTGNEAIARGAWEAGVKVAAAYPGTPSTEILETLADYPAEDLHAQWSTNEKVALDVAIGASFAGRRALAAMKHVGLNVAADAFMSINYIGVNGGLVLAVCDDPGIHSSQNEQDSRIYGMLSSVPVLEPSDAQEALDFTRLAFDLSETFDTPVIVRSTTRLSHTRSSVVTGDRKEPPQRAFIEKPSKNVMIPAYARPRHGVVIEREARLKAYFAESSINRWEAGDTSFGVITAGTCYPYVREVLPDANVLKLGASWPLPDDLMHRGKIIRIDLAHPLHADRAHQRFVVHLRRSLAPDRLAGTGMLLAAGHGGNMIVEQHHRDIGLIVDRVDELRNSGMQEGRIADGGNDRLGLAGLGHADGVADRRPHRHGGVNAAQRIEAGQRVAADIAGDTRAGRAYRHESRGVRAAGAQHRRTHQRFRRPLIISLQTRRQNAGLLEAGAHQLGRQLAGTRKEAFAFDLKSERADFLFDHRLELFDHENAIDRLAIAAQQVIRQRPGGAKLQHVGVGKHFAHIGVAGAGRDDAEAGVAFLPAIERGLGEIGFQLGLALDHQSVAWPRIGRDHDILRRLLDERTRRRHFAIADRHRTAGVRQPRRAAHDHWRIE